MSGVQIPPPLPFLPIELRKQTRPGALTFWLYLHSRESLRRLAAQHGLRVERMDDDSGSFQFWGSEQYRRGIALADPRGHGKAHRLFDKADMKALSRRAEALNREGEGDQLCLVLAPQ